MPAPEGPPIDRRTFFRVAIAEGLGVIKQKTGVGPGITNKVHAGPACPRCGGASEDGGSCAYCRKSATRGIEGALD